MKVKLLTSRAGNKPVKREEWEWVVDEDGKSKQVLVERETLEGFSQDAGQVIEVTQAEAKRLIEDGQAEAVAVHPRKRAESRSSGKPSAKKVAAKPKAKPNGDASTSPADK